MGPYLILLLTSLLASVIQATMGFGSALILLNVLPLYLPLNKAVALMQASLIVLNIVFTVRYWKKVRWDVLYPALIPAAVSGMVFALWSVSMEMSVLFIFLGVLFIFISVYELALSGRIRVKPDKKTGFLMGLLSGLGNGFFGIAGPPVAMYLAPSLDDNLEYFASSQCFFLFSSVPCLLARLISGIYVADDLPYLAVMTAGLVFGVAFGLVILKKIETKLLRKLIYGFIGLNGVYIIVKQFV